MACIGHVTGSACTSHVNSPCTGHTGSVPEGTPTVWTDVPLTTSIRIKAQHHNELRIAINTELAKRSHTWVHDPGAVNSTIKVLSTHVRDLRNGINAALAWTWPSILADVETEVGDKVLALQYNTLRDRVNYMETIPCSCNCNYTCTCLCNYACTCLCNYACTCNCNNCTCNCNYACTCVCNYACTCVCNYACTCQCDHVCICACNYCTCNCNYCTCECNYNCTCNCAYN